MKISVVSGIPDKHDGYAEAHQQIVKALSSLGYSIVPYTAADVKLWFCWPKWYKPNDPGYHIAYLPWESTEFPAGWLDKLNQMDEVWTTSDWLIDVFKSAGVKVPVYLYEHGVSDVWKPKKRIRGDIVKFSHFGGNALRKGLDITLKAFNTAFAGVDDVNLTLKLYEGGWNIPSFGRIKIIDDHLTVSQMVDLYESLDVMIYPSYSEGFGLFPAQAIANGMPTVCTAAWAPYRRYIDLPISSKEIDSPWEIHPGKVFEPNIDDLVDKLRYVYDNFDDCASRAYATGCAMSQDYEWQRVTAPVFSELENRLQR